MKPGRAGSRADWPGSAVGYELVKAWMGKGFDISALALGFVGGSGLGGPDGCLVTVLGMVPMAGGIDASRGPV
jgi:hypothetical protein